MRTLKKSGVTALTAGIALAIGAVPVAFVAPAIVAGGQTTAVAPAADPAATAAYQPYGWLAVETGATSKTTFTKAISYPGASAEDRTVVDDEDLYGIKKGPDGCLLSTRARSLDQTQTLLTFSAEAPGTESNVASLLDGSIGAAEKKSGTSCGQVQAPNETLTLGLNPTGLQTQTGSLVASSAYLDLELKGNAVVVATASLNGVAKETYRLESGSSRSGDGSAFECTGGSDSGPDSGVNDNCRWPISVPSWTNAAGNANDGVYFDTLVLTAETGSFSLEGGADGLVANPPPAEFPQTSSLIELVQPFEGTLTCSGDGSFAEEEPADGAPRVTVTRIGNSDGDPCIAIPYSLANALAEATFYKPLDSQTTAQFIIDLEWTIDPANGSDTDAPLLPESTIDYESDGNPSIDEDIPLRWCPDLVEDPSGFLVVDGVESKGYLDQDERLDGVQFACLITSDAAGVEGSDPAVVTLTQQVYLFGDARMRL